MPLQEKVFSFLFPFRFLLISFQVFRLINPRSLPVYIASSAFTSFAGASMTKA